MGWAAIIPVLIGGAIGGALPDIDIEGSAIEKMGGKTSAAVSKTIGKMGASGRRISRLTEAIGVAADTIFLGPLGRVWRFLSKNVFGRIYLKLYRFGKFGKNYDTLGEKLGWNGDPKPWAHRGGITHSLSFMVTSLVLVGPVAIIFQSPEFLLGCEIGIVSHLVTDSMCKSGVKYFFPWQPKIGFDNENHAGRGRDVRILPKGMQVSTGKDALTKNEIEEIKKADMDKGLKEARLRFREIMWQRIFQVLAIIVVVVLVAGVFGKGGIAFGFNGDDSAAKQEQTQTIADTSSDQTQNANTNAANNDSSTQGTEKTYSKLDTAQAGATVEGVDSISVDGTSYNSKPEIKGPTSLTYADLDIRDLPKGIMKLPDESLWVIGVGPVNEENLNNPRWTFTEEEKRRLLATVNAQRFEGIPNSVSNVVSATSTAFTNAANDVANGAKDVADSAKDAAGNAASGASDALGGLGSFFKDLTGIDIGGTSGSGSGSGYSGGFLGITAWTDSK